MPDLDSDHRSKMATYRIPPRTCLRKTPVRCVSEEGSYDDVGLMHLATRKGVFVWFQVSKLRVRRRERVQLRQLSDVKIRCFQRVSWCGKLANSTWTWRQWIYKVVWPHFFILMMCQICRTSRIRWRGLRECYSRTSKSPCHTAEYSLHSMPHLRWTRQQG